MVVVDIDHPDIEEFIKWKVTEEQKVASIVTGSKICSKHLKTIMNATTAKLMVKVVLNLQKTQL